MTRLGRMTALILALLVSPLVVGSASPSMGEPAPSRPLLVEVLSPTASAVVSGGLAVTVRVTTDPDVSVTSAAVSMRSASVRVDALVGKSCPLGCVETVHLDTLAPGSAVPVVPDGKADLKAVAEARNEAGSQWYDDAVVPVVADNGLPTLTIEGMESYQPDSGDNYPLTVTGSSLAVAAHPRARAGGSITRVTMRLPSTTVDLTPPATPGAAWTYAWDLSAMPNAASFHQDLVAWDDRGVAGPATFVSGVVDRGFVLELPSWPDPVTDDALNVVDLATVYRVLTDGTRVTPRATRLTKVEVMVDGKTFGGDVALTWARPGAWSVWQEDQIRVPQGRHTLGFVATDSRGIAGRADAAVDVTTTLPISLQPPAAPVLPGRPFPVHLRAESSVTTIVNWFMWPDDDMAVRQGGSCIAGVAICTSTVDERRSFVLTTPGRHQLHVTAQPDGGWSQTASAYVTVLPWASPAALTGQPVVQGSSALLHGRVTLTDGRPAPGAGVTLERMGATGQWLAIARASTDVAGRVSFPVRQQVGTSYRLRTADADGRWGGRAGPAMRLGSLLRFAVPSKAVRTRLGRTVKVRIGVSSVPRPGWPFNLQEFVAGRWRAAHGGHATDSGPRSVALVYKGKIGKHRLRIVWPGGGGVSRSASAPFTVRVRHH